MILAFLFQFKICKVRWWWYHHFLPASIRCGRFKLISYNNKICLIARIKNKLKPGQVWVSKAWHEHSANLSSNCPGYALKSSAGFNNSLNPPIPDSYSNCREDKILVSIVEVIKIFLLVFCRTVKGHVFVKTWKHSFRLLSLFVAQSSMLSSIATHGGANVCRG